jgi:hypothetical protein
MINSTPSAGSTPESNAVSLDLSKTSSRPYSPARDRLSLDQGDSLDSALSSQPEIRPEMVAKGLALAADPGYPSQSIISQVAGQIVNSPDLSEDPA